MSIDFIRRNLAERLGGTRFGTEGASYKFEKIKRAAAAAIRQRPDLKLLELGVGEPDDMADEAVVSKLSAEAMLRKNRGYADNGIQAFKQAAADYLKHLFQVDHIDPESEVVHSIGSKSALAILPSCFINPGDVTIMTVPGYPILGTNTRYLGGEVYNVDLTEDLAYLPDLEAIPKDICRRAKLLYLNYPNNPTGAAADAGFFEKVVEFARENQIIVVHDAAYAALTYKGTLPLSFLSVPGGKDVGVELHSLSKSHNMTGWRIGFVAGNPLIVKAFSDARNNFDSGQFIAIQQAAIDALEHSQIIKNNNLKYSRRLDLLVEALNELGFPASKPKGSFFLYVKAPKGIRGSQSFETAEDFSQYLILEKGIVSVPWDDAGSYIRFSATFEARTVEEESAVIDELKKRLADVDFEFE